MEVSAIRDKRENNRQNLIKITENGANYRNMVLQIESLK